MKETPYILWLELRGFYAKADSRPIIVVRDKVVLDANRTAQRQGIDAGMSFRQARAIAEGGVFQTWQAKEFEERQRAWLDACVEYTGVIEPADQHSAWLDLSLHPNPVDVIEQLIRELIRRTNLQVRYGAAPSKWIAYLAAQHGDCGLAMRDPAAFLACLPTEALLPALPAHIERLRFLGYQTIGAVAGLSRATLQDQFDEQALLIHSAARGALRQVPNAVYPSDSVAESIVFESAVEDLETIAATCQMLAERIGSRLATRQMQSGKLRVTLGFEDNELRKLSRTFTKPLRCPRSVYSAMRLLLDPALNAPIASIRVYIPDLEKVRQFQPSLMHSSVTRSTTQVEAAMSQVKKVFGDRSIQLGQEIVLPRRQKVLKEWKRATGWR